MEEMSRCLSRRELLAALLLFALLTLLTPSALGAGCLAAREDLGPARPELHPGAVRLQRAGTCAIPRTATRPTTVPGATPT